MLLDLLPAELRGRLEECYVDKKAVAMGEEGGFVFFELESGKERWRVPPSQRIRVSRERLRGLLSEGLDVKVSPVLGSR